MVVVINHIHICHICATVFLSLNFNGAVTLTISGGAGDFASNNPAEAAAVATASQWSQRLEVTPPSSPKGQPSKLDSTDMQWPPEGMLHPLAHSSPAFLQGPGLMFSQQSQQQQKTSTAGRAGFDYNPSGAMYFPGGGDSSQGMSSMSSRQWSGGYEAAGGQENNLMDPWNM